MWIVSGLGDLLVLLAASLALIALLARIGAVGEAVAYVKALSFCLIATFAMKFALAICGVGERLGVESPSGHVAFAATFYGALALMLGARRAAASKLLLAAGVVALGIFVGVSRVALNAHNPAETIVDAATGLVALAIFFFNEPKRAPSDQPLSLVSTLAPLAAVYIVLALPIVSHWSAEPWIDAMADQFAAVTNLCR